MAMGEISKKRDCTQLEPFPDVVELDCLDRKILTLLQDDAKMSLRTIAEITDHSASTIKSHIDALINQKVIENFIAVVNCNRIGYREMIHFYIQVLPVVKFQQIIDELLSIPELNAIYHLSGEYPIFCIAKCVEKKGQIALIEQIKSIHGIEKITTQIVIQRIKEDMRVSIPMDKVDIIIPKS